MHIRATSFVLAAAIVVQLAVGVRVATTFPETPDLPAMAVEDGRDGFIAVLQSSFDEVAVDATEGVDRMAAPVQPCLGVVDATTGEYRLSTCDNADTFAGWSSAGRMLLLQRGPTGESRAVDPVTGTIAPTDLDRPLTGIPPVSAVTRAGDGRVALVVDDATVWSARVPKGYELGDPVPSPDGEYVLVIDSEGRLLVADTDEPGRPEVVATGVRRAAWFQPGRFPSTLVSGTRHEEFEL